MNAADVTRREADDAANAALTQALDDLRAAVAALAGPREAVLALLSDYRDRVSRALVLVPVRTAIEKILDAEINAVHEFAQQVGRRS